MLSLSLATAFTPQICFRVSSFVLVCVWLSCVCPLVLSARVCRALLVSVVKKAQQTPRTSPAALLQKYMSVTLPFPFLPSFRFRGKDCGKAGMGGCPTNTPWKEQCRPRNKKPQNRRNSKDWRLARDLQTHFRWELSSVHGCHVENRETKSGSLTSTLEGRDRCSGHKSSKKISMLMWHLVWTFVR